MLKTISITSGKGGVGKSLISLNVAGALVSKGYRVLVIDMDKMASMTDNMIAEEDISTINVLPTIASIFRKVVRPSEIITKNPLKDYPGLDLIASDAELDAIGEVLKAKTPSFNKVLKKWITKNLEELSADYDFIVVDTNPILSCATQCALFAADYIFLISDGTNNSLNGAIKIYFAWNELCEDMEIPNKMRGIILNNIDIRIGSTKMFLETVYREELPLPLYKNFIKYNSKIRDSQYSVPVTLSKDISVLKNDGVQTFMELMKELEKEVLL